MGSTSCPRCGREAWHVTGTNGADYPDPLTEVRECECGRSWTVTMTPKDGGTLD